MDEVDRERGAEVAQAEKERRKALRTAYKASVRAQAWDALGIDRQSLDSLYAFVESRGAGQGCDHTLRFTEAWIRDHAEVDGPRLLGALRDAGGYCDCEVLMNTDPDETL